jgi:hypothetical protein
MHDEFPYRLVDCNDLGWWHNGDGRFCASDHFVSGLPPTPYATLITQRGPVRPVEPITDVDAQVLTTALVEAGPLAAGSVLVALFRLFRGPDLPTAPERSASMEDRARKLVAGRSGSWEADAIRSLAWGPGCDLADKPKRFHASTVEAIVDMVWQWVTDPLRFTEVAETLASEFDQVTRTAGGWDNVADRFLIPGSRFSLAATERIIGYLHGSCTMAYRDTGRGSSIEGGNDD